MIACFTLYPLSFTLARSAIKAIMIRSIFSLIIVLLILSPSLPVMAATVPSSEYNYTEEQLQQGEQLAKQALEVSQTGDFSKAEQLWTQLIEQFPNNPAVWSNRGNIRVSQNKLGEAIADFDQAIELAPEYPDSYLNRGTALEAQKRYDEAIADYEKVLTISPNDAMAYNNRGNAKAGKGQWEDAIADYQKAVQLVPNFAFARANYALALYQTKQQKSAILTMRELVRKYPMFADMRAALTAVLWVQGNQGEAESNWVSVIGVDERYQDLDWVENIRRWPPKMVAALDSFLNLE